MGICYIVGAGEFYGAITRREGDLIIAADGGYDTLQSMGIECDLLIGDMDSVIRQTEEVERLLFPVEKDDTDTALAYEEGVRRGYTEFMLYGCVGGREDHTFANYSLLAHAAERGHKMTLVGRARSLVIDSTSTTVYGKKGDTVSVFAFGGVAKGVTLSGLKYPLSDGTLTPFVALGVSNELLGSSAEISVKEGKLLIMAEV